MNNIYIATHKNYNFPSDYKPLHVGKEYSEITIPNSISDNINDNISNLNPFFCELTGLYWIWKNEHSEIVGLVHYRRYFRYKRDFEYVNNIKVATKYDLIAELSNYDIILPTPAYLFRQTLKEQYIKNHKEDDFYRTRDIIEKIYPEYVTTFDSVFSGSKGYYCNMFVAKRNVIEPYFKWVFDILFELHNQIDLSTYDNYQRRVFGFLSERLFAVWIEYNKSNMTICHRDVVETEAKKTIELKRKIRNFISKMIIK